MVLAGGFALVLDGTVVDEDGALLLACESLLSLLLPPLDEVVSFPFPVTFTDSSTAVVMSDGVEVEGVAVGTGSGAPTTEPSTEEEEEDVNDDDCDGAGVVASSLRYFASMESRERLAGRSISKLHASPDNFRNTHILSPCGNSDGGETAAAASTAGRRSGLSDASNDGVPADVFSGGGTLSINFGHGTGSAPMLRRASI